MIKKEIKGLTVGELRKCLEDTPDSAFIVLENISDKRYYKDGYEDAILTCDENQFSCYDFKIKGEEACKNCYYAHTYTAASRVVKSDGIIYLDVTI